MPSASQNDTVVIELESLDVLSSRLLKYTVHKTWLLDMDPLTHLLCYLTRLPRL